LYPTIIVVTAAKDSLHNNGKKYAVIHEIVYDMWGQPKSGALGNIYRRTYLQRADSLSLNVYRIDPRVNIRYGDEILFDSLKAKVGDLILTNQYRDLYFSESGLSEFLGRQRAFRRLHVENALVGFRFKTVEGLGEFRWDNDGEGEPSFAELRAAVIKGDTLGVLLRLQAAALQLNVPRLDFSPDLKKQTIQFRNLSVGLAIIDSVKIKTPDRFYSQLSYRGGQYAEKSFSEGPFLVFPNDSVQLDLFLHDNALDQAFMDTFRVFAHGLDGKNLPAVALPITFSPKVGVHDHTKNSTLPQQIHLSVHPNPSPQRFVISYHLFQRSRINLHALDLLGREVAALTNEDMPAGDHQFSWETAKLPAGIYFIVLETRRERLVQKIYIVR
jgi:hypothetical protein